MCRGRLMSRALQVGTQRGLYMCGREQLCEGLGWGGAAYAFMICLCIKKQGLTSFSPEATQVLLTYVLHYPHLLIVRGLACCWSQIVWPFPMGTVPTGAQWK
jgi:hypothetical protein